MPSSFSGRASGWLSLPIIALAAIPAPVSAQVADQPGPISQPSGAMSASGAAPAFEDLLRQSLSAPRRAILEAEIARASGLAEQARVRPNPSVSLTAENILGQNPYSGFNRSETTLQVNQPIELGGKRSARIAAGEAGVAAAKARASDGRIVYAYDLARAYAAAEASERRVTLAEEALREANEDLRAARALVGAGKEARLRSLQAEAEVSALVAELDGAQAGRVAAMARLSALAGVDQPYSGIAQPLLGRAVGPASPEIGSTRTSEVAVAEAEREFASRRVSVERSRAIPDVTASVGVRRLEVDKAQAVVAGVSFPLSLFDRNRGNIAAARAELQAADAQLAVARLEAEAGLRSAYRQVEAADLRMAAATTSLNTAQETYRLARLAYEAGKSPLIELIAARRGVGQARGIVLDAQAAQFEARAALARLQGRTVTGEPVQ